MSKYYAVIDIGGTKILLLLFDEHNNLIYRQRKNTPKPSSPEAVQSVIQQMLETGFSELGLIQAESLKAIGVCFAGFVDFASGIIHQAPNLFWTEPVPFKAMVEHQFNCPVIIENDANAAVVGEVHYGAARGHRDAIYVTISTGIGSGLFLDGKLYRGRNGFAGEVGHLKAYGINRPCNCGGEDCLETWVSGSGLAKSASQIWSDQEIGSGQDKTAWLFDEAGRGNSIAKVIIDHAIKNTGRGLANLVTLLNPSCLVIGGGVAANQKQYFSQIITEIRREAIKPSTSITSLDIVKAKLEPEGGAWGMYALLTGRILE